MSEKKRDPLKNSEIILLRSLAMRGGAMRPTTISNWQREFAVPLSRGGIIEIWYRQVLSEQPSLQGPYFGLTTAGALLASHFLPAPRGISGAEQE